MIAHLLLILNQCCSETPFSMLGGAVNLPVSIYQPIVGALLLLASAQMIRSAASADHLDRKVPVAPPFMPSLLAGGAIGFVSGITGVGGGIFLAPVVLSFGWVDTRQTSAVSAIFNLLNSAAALAGTWAILPALPEHLPWWLLAVGVGGFMGSWLGSRHLSATVLRYILAALLITAGVRMLFG